MVPNFNLCDICGEQVSKACHLTVVTSHDHDNNGEYNPITRHVDLCPKHQADAIKLLLEEPTRKTVASEEQGKRLSVFIDQMKKAVSK